MIGVTAGPASAPPIVNSSFFAASQPNRERRSIAIRSMPQQQSGRQEPLPFSHPPPVRGREPIAGSICQSTRCVTDQTGRIVFNAGEARWHMTKSEKTRLNNLLEKRRFVQLSSVELKILARLEAVSALFGQPHVPPDCQLESARRM